MFLHHLQLLIQKSARYAWRRRTCCCPKVIFELFVPAICLLLLILIRWIHTKPSNNANGVSTRIQLAELSIIAQEESNYVINSTFNFRCPTLNINVEMNDTDIYRQLKSKCSSMSRIRLHNRTQTSTGIWINRTPTGHDLSYRCSFYEKSWCQNLSEFIQTKKSIEIQHPSSSVCSNEITQYSNDLLKELFNIESMLYPSTKWPKLFVFTWPCKSYLLDPLFDLAPTFVLRVILLLIDGCIIYGFNQLFYSIIDEKHQGITELLRLISIQPILNSFAWFLRMFFVQILINIVLIIILKVSFEGGIYLHYVSIWLILPSIFLWSIQVFSRSVFVAHFLNNNLKATLWSWFVYVISILLGLSSVRLPFLLHFIVSTWLPFYSIKRLFILLFRINHDLGRFTYLTTEIFYIWLSMIIGSCLMWLLASYFEQIQPGKYGVPRSWSWIVDYIRNNTKKFSKRRESVTMQMVETLPNLNTTVRVNNLTKTYGHFNTETHVAVDHISFTLEKSMIHGLIGHNGAGKTSTMEMLCGLLSYDCGTIEIHDKDLQEHLSELQKTIGYCPQHDMLFSFLTVREQLEFYARVRSKNNFIDKNNIEHYLAMMDMNQSSNKLCHTLSGGMKRKLSILCAFVGDANIIVLDEPSSSLDPVARRMLWSWLRENKANRTLLISSHLLDEVEELCDTIIILDDGKVRAQGTILELKQKFGPPGDRIHLDRIPSYVPKQFIIDEKANFIQIPDRDQLIGLLKKFEADNIKYSLENVTLDDIFLKLTSSNESSFSLEENKNQMQINELFNKRTNSNQFQLLFQQILGVSIRRYAILLKKIYFIIVILCIYLVFTLSPLYMPSFSLSSLPSNNIQYIVSTPKKLVPRLSFKNVNIKFTSSFYSPTQFQEYLLEIPTWQSNHQGYQIFIGLRIPSIDHLECYAPSPTFANVIESCFPMAKLLSNQTTNSINIVSYQQGNSLSALSSLRLSNFDSILYCFYTLPLNLHLSLMLLSFVLLICVSLTIGDRTSGLHSYSLIHGLRSPIHWIVTFVNDLILCLIWYIIVIIIARFVHSEPFNGRFYALAILYFVTLLPFVYFLSKAFQSSILGATAIIFILQFAHAIYSFRILIELLQGIRGVSIILRIIRWLMIIIFPNVNFYALAVYILRPILCPNSEQTDTNVTEFRFERYSHATLIHALIMIFHIIFYFLLLIIIDQCKFNLFRCHFNKSIEREEADDDVKHERNRIETMSIEDKESESLIVNNLTKRYFGSKSLAVNNLSFAVPQRECFGLLGFNGSGKTTTFRMLVGDLLPTSGYVYKTNKQSIGYCPQDDIKFPSLTVLQSINYICRIHGLNPSSLNHIILSQFQLEKCRNRLVSHLSGGTCRRLHLALCLIGSPTLLLLDEPTAKVDPLLRSHIRLILHHRPIDTSIVFASHSMLECEQLCDRLTILVHGNARCLGSPRHIKNKFGTDYRIRLTLRNETYEIPSLKRIGNSNEYTYPKTNLSDVFQLLQNLVKQNITDDNYTIQLTSLEHIFLGFQHM